MSAINISKNLKYLRKKKGLTQLQVRSSLGHTRSTWSNYENGLTNPSINDLIAFSRFFGISLDDLVLHDLEAQESSPENANNSSHKPIAYPTNDVATVTSEPEIVYLLREIKKLQEDVNMIKEWKEKT